MPPQYASDGAVAHRRRRHHAAITQVLAGNPTGDLLDIEMAFRAAACASYLIATTEGRSSLCASLDRRA